MLLHVNRGSPKKVVTSFEFPGASNDFILIDLNCSFGQGKTHVINKIIDFQVSFVRIEKRSAV
jgi:hypothetical protein